MMRILMPNTALNYRHRIYILYYTLAFLLATMERRLRLTLAVLLLLLLLLLLLSTARIVLTVSFVARARLLYLNVCKI